MNKVKYVFRYISIAFLACLLSACVLCSCGSNGNSSPKKDEDYFRLSEEAIRINEGAYATLAVQTSYVGLEYEWYSYDPEVATVNNGTVNGIKSGTTTILVTSGALSATCDVTVIKTEAEKKSLRVVLSRQTLTLDAESEEGKNYTLSVSVTYNNQPIDARIEWSSSDEGVVTVNDGLLTAVANDGTAQISAKVNYNGVETVAYCTVVTQRYAVIVPAVREILLYPDETQALDYSLTIGGVQSAEEKSNVLITSSDEGCVSVDAGVIKALKPGEVQITLKYGTVEETITVVVAEEIYISSAEQFMQIDGADSRIRFKLQNDIDFGEYFQSNPFFDREYLIQSFSAKLDGQGYNVSGLNRLSATEDTGFVGLFNMVSATAEITDIGFYGSTQTSGNSNIFAKYSCGSFKNCYFEFDNVTSQAARCSFIGNSDSAFDSCVFNLSSSTVSGEKNELIVFSSYGTGSYRGVTILENNAVSATYIDGIGNSLNESVIESFVFDKSDKKIYSLTPSGKGGVTALSLSSVLDGETWVTDGETCVWLKNASGSRVSAAPSIGAVTYEPIAYGSGVDVKTPEVDGGSEWSFRFFDKNGRDVTAAMVSGTEDEGFRFVPQYSGKFVLQYSATYSGSIVSNIISVIDVVDVGLSPIDGALVLKTGDAGAVGIVGMDISDFYLYSSDETVLKVGADGSLTPLKDGVASVKMVNKVSGQSACTIVSVINDFVYISTADELKALNEEDTNGKYYVLKNDITLDKSYFTSEARAAYPDQVCDFIIKEFYGTLDGQGNKIIVNYVGNKYNILSGLFYTLKPESTVKNLIYEFEGFDYKTDKTAYYGCFAFESQGKINNCYFDATFNAEENKDKEAIIAVIGNKTMDNLVSECSNCIFNLTVKIDGEVVDCGTAINRGTSRPRVKNSVLIKNGASRNFYGFYTSSAIECTGAYHYFTAYDFVNGLNGASSNVAKTIASVSDGTMVYAQWDAVWDISTDGIYLFNRKICDVEYEERNVSQTLVLAVNDGILSWEGAEEEYGIYINGQYSATVYGTQFNLKQHIYTTLGIEGASYVVSVRNGYTSGACLYKTENPMRIDKGILSWELEQSSTDIYVDDTLVTTISDSQVDIKSLILEKFGTQAKDYTVRIRYGEQYAAIGFSVVRLDSSNFISELRKTNSPYVESYTLYLLTENITIKESDFSINKGFKVVFATPYAHVDGLGHKIYADLDFRQNGTEYTLGGLIWDLNGLWENLAFEYNAKYYAGNGNAVVRGFFANNLTVYGGIKNCFFNVNVTPYSKDDNQICSDATASVIGYTQGTKDGYSSVIENCIFYVRVNSAEGIGVDGAAFNTAVGYTPHYKNIICIKESATPIIALTPNGRVFENCYYYSSLSDFLNSGKAYSTSSDGKTFTETTGTCSAVGENWEISQFAVKLCGEYVYFDIGNSDDDASDFEFKTAS